jgi:hypothetical protein
MFIIFGLKFWIISLLAQLKSHVKQFVEFDLELLMKLRKNDR